jgi:hypothetical protein
MALRVEKVICCIFSPPLMFPFGNAGGRIAKVLNDLKAYSSAQTKKAPENRGWGFYLRTPAAAEAFCPRGFFCLYTYHLFLFRQGESFFA